MASVVQQPFDMPVPEAASEWRLNNSRTRLVRSLRGVELIVNSSEHHCDGNFQLTCKSTLESPLSCEQLKRRHQAAWWRTRRIHPVVGVDFPAIEEASFNVIESRKAAEDWASRTCRVATNTTVDDVYIERSRKARDTTTMTLVIDPSRGARGCVLSMSHTLVSTMIYRIIQEYIFQLARPDTELGLAAVFQPESAAEASSRLPSSLSNAYHLTHNPTPSDLQDAFAMHQRAQERWARPSIGIPLHPEYKTRASRIHNKTITFEPAESVAAFNFLKRSGITLTAAFFACITSAIAHLYPQEGPDPEGAHLCFSVNGRRYLDTEGRPGRTGPVMMPILPGSTWVDAREVNLRPTTQKGLLRLASAIGRAQNEDLASPHLIAVFDQIAPDLVRALNDAQHLPGGPPDPPAFGRPTLTSQGQFSNNRDKLAARGSDEVRMTDFNVGGRTTDPTVCFSLNSFRDELRFNMLFDERFFPQSDVGLLGQVVARLFRRVVGVEDGGVQQVRARL
ncbi:uncharacterized protein BDV17DRAFT_290425 [Aspergillus undulatus]|uniref:uncharacterized protein n=1 Tax=Aspergillus undulatus TaxID=1810928 RepID=UPI003CCD3A89